MNIDERKFRIECTPENAPSFWKWLQERGGIARWTSVNLSNPGAGWSTPATIRKADCEGFKEGDPGADEIVPYPKPTWQAGSTPEIVTDPSLVVVYEDALYKAFRVGLRGKGMSLLLTNGAQRKVDKYLAECKEKHGDAFYRKGVLDIDGASIGIYYTTAITPIADWIAARKEVQS